MLGNGIDWTSFARRAVSHGVVGLVGDSLERIAPDLVPDDVLDAWRMHKEHIRFGNKLVAEGFHRSAAALANYGVEAIWFEGPVLARRAYGDRELRLLGAPRALVREQSAADAIQALQGVGYQRQAHLTAAQLDFMRYLQGYETLSNRSYALSADVCTRLTPITTGLAVDYDGLWQRAGAETGFHRSIRSLAPEDELLALSIRAATQRAWPLAEACDFAALLAALPGLDLSAVEERARAQGCLSMLRLAISLARRHLGATIDEPQPCSPTIEAMICRIVARWEAQEPGSARVEGPSSLDLLRLHDGTTRKARYLGRSLALPAAPHVSRVALPARFTNVPIYALIKLAQEGAALPLLRAGRKSRALARRLRDLLVSRGLCLSIVPASKEQRVFWRRQHAARIAAQQLVARNPDNPAAWQALGDALLCLGRHAAAVDAYDRALAHVPDNALLLRRRAAAIRAGGAKMTALDTHQQALLNPDDADAWARHAASLETAKRFAEAIVAADSALAINPAHRAAMRTGIRSRISSCDWRRSDEDERLVAEAFNAGFSLLTPAGNRAISDSEAQNLTAAQLWARRFVLPQASLPRPRRYSHDRIRLAYVCSEYHDHPVGLHMVGVLEQHDRSRFETTAVSLGAPNSSALRHRIQRACDQFLDVHDMSDEQIANTISNMEIDIAIDLDRFASKTEAGVISGSYR